MTAAATDLGVAATATYSAAAASDMGVAAAASDLGLAAAASKSAVAVAASDLGVAVAASDWEWQRQHQILAQQRLRQIWGGASDLGGAAAALNLVVGP